MKRLFFLLVVTIALHACNNNDSDAVDPSLPVQPVVAAPKAISYTVIAQYPHDTSSFTEGLEFYNGKLYESGGEYEESRLQYGDARTGKVEKRQMMGTKDIFGEGLTILNGKLYQLTYTTNTVFVYDIKDITKVIKTFKWPGQGWGLTNNGTDLILDAGNYNLYFVDPETFAVKKTIPVTDNAGTVNMINELEYFDGFIWANVWQSDRIVKIDPATGYVVGDMNMKNLLPDNLRTERTDVLNGIAYDSTSKTLFITGKRWPKIYEVRIN